MYVCMYACKQKDSRPHLPEANLVATLETLCRRSEYSSEGIPHLIELDSPVEHGHEYDYKNRATQIQEALYQYIIYRIQKDIISYYKSNVYTNG